MPDTHGNGSERVEDTIQSPSQLPLSQRRYIAVVSDDQFDKSKDESSNWTYGGLVWDVIPLVIPGGPLARAGSTLAIKAFRHWNENKKIKTKRAGTLIQAMPMREAGNFLFLGGCPEVGRAYAANPLDDRTYFSVETYNDDMVDHKLSELERILNSLGARQYEIVFQSDENVHGKISGGIERRAFFKKGEKAKMEAELHRARAKRFERSGTSHGRDPVLAPNLVWLEREASWKALVESRLQYGRKDFHLRVDLDRDMKLSAQASLDFKAIGLNVGAEFEKKTNFTLTVKGSFAE